MHTIMSLMFIPGYTMDAGHFAIWVKQLQDARTELVAEAQGACLCLWYLLLACVGHCTFMLQCLLVDERGRVRVCVCGMWICCVGCGWVGMSASRSVPHTASLSYPFPLRPLLVSQRNTLERFAAPGNGPPSQQTTP